MDKFTALYNNFGWVYSCTEDARPDSTVLIILERDKKIFGRDYGRIKYLERQYEAVNNVKPTRAIVMAILSAILYLGYIGTKPIFAFYIAFYYLSLTFLAIAVFSLVTYIFLAISKKNISKKILNQAGILSGAIRDFPLKINIQAEEANTWTIRKIFFSQMPLTKK